MKRGAGGFSFTEALIALIILMGVMAIALAFFVDFGQTMNTESSTLATQQSGRVVLDELTRNLRQIGYGIRRPDPYNPARWQRAIVYAGSHELAFNADIDSSIGAIPKSESIDFPTGPAYEGEGIAAFEIGAETYVYTIDADGNHKFETADRSAAELGSYNPAAETHNPLDFGLFRKVYGYNGSTYGGAPEPLAAYLFTNGTDDITFPADGTSPAPLFTYWLTEDLNEDGVLARKECVNTSIDTCPPSSPRDPLLYVWGDTDFDGLLSEAEKSALREAEVGSTQWTKNILVSAGAYKSTSLAAPIDPASQNSYLVKVASASEFGPGYHIKIGSEVFYVDETVTTKTPHQLLLSSSPKQVHVLGEKVEILPSTLLRAIRAVEINYTTITDRQDISAGVAAAGRAGRRGTGGLDYRVASFRRRVEVINAPTSAMANPSGASDICPLKIVNSCSGEPFEDGVRLASLPDQKDLVFVVTDYDNNLVPGIEVQFFNDNTGVGSLVEEQPVTDGDGTAIVGYTPLGAMGTDLVRAEVSCILDSGLEQVAAATKTMSVYQLTTGLPVDCLSTISDFTSNPNAGFTLELRSPSGPVSGHPVGLGLSVERPNLSGDVSAPVVGELMLGLSSAGTTDDQGQLGVTTTTDGNGQIVGAVELAKDDARAGAELTLNTQVFDPACGTKVGDLTQSLGFFKLTLDSTVPVSGCTAAAPCIIGDGTPVPRVEADLSIAGMPAAGTPVDFETTDFNPPTDGTDTAASILIPGSRRTTDSSGTARVIVANNGSPLITPVTPLVTFVDVTSPGPATMCSSGAIASSSEQAGFEFHRPTDLCGTEVQPSWVKRTQDDQVCVSVRNSAELEGCPVDVVGVQITIYEADGTTLDATQGSLIKKIEGGHVGTTAGCANGGAVRLFEDKCRIPQAKLPNGETWMFTSYQSCEVPTAGPDPQQFFTIHKIQFEANYPPGRPMDITIYYQCRGDCDGGSTEARTFRVTTPF